MVRRFVPRVRQVHGGVCDAHAGQGRQDEGSPATSVRQTVEQRCLRGGQALAVKTVEKTYLNNGSEHLINYETYKKNT